MQKRIAFLSSINVGKKNRLRSHELKRLFESLGFKGVKCALQSGNVIFQAGNGSANTLEKRIDRLFESSFNTSSRAFVRSLFAVEQLAGEIPWDSDPSKVHVFLLRSKLSDAACERLDEARINSEQLVFREECTWLFAPNGLARSKIAARASDLIGQPTTSRSVSALRKVLQAAARG